MGGWEDARVRGWRGVKVCTGGFGGIGSSGAAATFLCGVQKNTQNIIYRVSKVVKWPNDV